MIRRLIPWYLRHARHPFKDKVTGHYWSWLTREPLWIEYDGGLRFKADLRDYIQQKVFFDGYYEPGLVAWLKHALRPSDVFWDVGANVGAITLVAARRCRKVVAFEPEPAARQRLDEHVTVNGLDNVVVLPVALAADDGFAQLTLGPRTNTGMNSLSPGERGRDTVEVATRRADSLLEEGQCEAPDIMKIDVEGAELAVFRGAARLLRSPRLRAIVFEAAESEPGKLASAEIGAALEDSGFTITVLGYSDPDAGGNLNNFIASRTGP